MKIKRFLEVIGITLFILVLFSANMALGWIIEPDNIIYGHIYVDDIQLTGTDTSYRVTLEVGGTEIAEYSMGDINGDYYVLTVPMVSANHITEQIPPGGFAKAGDIGKIKVNGEDPISLINITLGQRGSIYYQDIRLKDITILISLTQGLNIIGYPKDPPSGYSAFDFLYDVGEANINGISRLNQAFMRTENAGWIEGEVEGVNFPIVPGEGYIIYMKQDKDLDTSGTPCTKVPLLLKQGINIVSIPGTSSGYSAFDFLQDVGEVGINGISRINKELMRAENAGWVEGEVEGVDFPIKDEEGYIVYMKQDMEVTY